MSSPSGSTLIKWIAQWSHSFYLGSYFCSGHSQILSEKNQHRFFSTALSGSGLGIRVTLANCRQSLNLAWLVMHSPHLRHLRKRPADGGRHASAVKQNFCRLLFSLSTQLLACVSTCIHRHTVVGTHAPAACSDVIANKTAVPCTIGVHTLTVLPHLSSS